MLQKEPLREADAVTSLILAGLGLAVCIGAVRMPMGGTYAGMPIDWYTSPGFFPLALGVMLMLGALAVFVTSWRDKAPKRLVVRAKPVFHALLRSRTAARMLGIWTLLLGYVLCLAWHPFVGLAKPFESFGTSPWTMFLIEPEGANYVASSVVFLALFMYIFYYRTRPHRTWPALFGLLGLCLTTAWGVGYVFTQHLYTPLPW